MSQAVDLSIEAWSTAKESPERQLWIAVLRRAVLDAVDARCSAAERRSARRYLGSQAVELHCWYAGIERWQLERILRRCGGD